MYVYVHEQYMDVHVHLHVQKCTRFLHTFTHIYKYIYIVKFRFVSFRRIFGRNFAETKRNTELAKRNFGEISRNFAEISFRDETEKFYFGGTILTTYMLYSTAQYTAPECGKTVP
jgi:sulfatase maturation enzyme AslB (radical SAM superfamily)